MKKLITVVFILISMQLSADSTLATIRGLYKEAPRLESSCRKLLVITDTSVHQDKALMKGYKGSTLMIMAKHLASPFSKLSSFNKGKRLLEESIAAQPSDAELRFLRFSVQSASPEFLGYNKSLGDDKRFLLGAFRTIGDEELKKIIAAFMLQSDLVTPPEKKVFND